MLRNRLLAATAAFALAVGQVSPGWALLPSPQFQTPDGIDPAKAANAGFVSTAIANLQAYIVGLLGGKLSHVANASVLSGLKVYAVPIMRDDIGVLYADTGASCTISGGDGGWQVQPETGHCWKTDISKGAPITLWNAPADDATDIQPYLAKAYTALVAAAAGGTLVFPATTSCFRLSTPYTFASLTNVTLDGTNSCLDINFATGDALTVNGGSNVLLKGMTIKHAVARTLGNDVEVTGGARNVTLRNITCLANHYSCVGVDGGAAIVSIEDLYVPGEGQTGICLGCEASGIAANVVIKGGDFNYQHRAAIELQYASGITIRETNTDFNTHGLWAHPPAGQAVNGIDTDATVYFDSSTQEGVLIDASVGQVFENRMVSATWIASCGGAIPSQFSSNYNQSFTNNPTAACLSVSGTSALLVDNRFDITELNSSGPGIILNGGKDNYFSGTVASNGAGCPLASPCSGFQIGVNTSNWGWDGRAGGQTGIGPSSNQAYGVYNNGGSSSDYYYIRGNLSGNATGAFVDFGQGIHKSYDGMVPAAPWQNYSPTVSASSGTFTALAGTTAGQYQVRGSTVTFIVEIDITTNGSAAGQILVSLPLAASNIVSAVIPGREVSSTGNSLWGTIGAGTNTQMSVVNANGNTYAGGNGYKLVLNGSYQIGSP